MEKQRKITQYRERLDKTLASPDLTNGEMIKSLVKSQLLGSLQPGVEGYSETVLEKRTSEVANFLHMLRSVSLNVDEAPKAHDSAHPEWKLKQDTEEFRVMYREGDEGTPFHTLLVEGYVDGPVDQCLCVSWESSLYRKWWPQSAVPTFKILSSKCVQKVRIGEQISLVRMKVTWPLSVREALVHYFEFEYIRDDLVVVLINTISDAENINRDTHGFSRDGIPEAKDGVRIDLVGGFVIQRVTPERSYFRTIARMDIKMDFVPPSLINFIARQLVGNGFRLYEKIVATAFKTDEDFSKALADPLYVRIRNALSSSDEPNGVLEQDDEPNGVLEQDELNSDTFSLPEEHSLGNILLEEAEGRNGESEDRDSESSEKSVIPTVKKASCEIEEEHSEDNAPLDQDLTDTLVNKRYANGNKRVAVSPKVEEALGTLDKVIYLIQEYGINTPSRDASAVANVVKVSSPAACGEVHEKEVVETSSQEPRNKSSDNHGSRPSKLNGVNYNNITPASPERNHIKHDEAHRVALPFSVNGSVSEEGKARGKSSLPGGARSGRRRKLRLCCVGYNFE